MRRAARLLCDATREGAAPFRHSAPEPLHYCAAGVSGLVNEPDATLLEVSTRVSIRGATWRQIQRFQRRRSPSSYPNLTPSRGPNPHQPPTLTRWPRRSSRCSLRVCAWTTPPPSRRTSSCAAGHHPMRDSPTSPPVTGADHRPALSDNEQRAVPRTPAVAPEVTRGCGGVKWPVGPAAWPCVCSSGPLLCLIAAVASPLGQLRRGSTTRESQQHPAASVKGGQWTSPVRQWREQCASTVAHAPARCSDGGQEGPRR